MIQEQTILDCKLCSLINGGDSQHYLTINQSINSGHESMFYQLGKLIQNNNLVPLFHFVFGSAELHKLQLVDLESIIGEIKWPVMYVLSESPKKPAISGIQVFAVSGKKCTPVLLDGRLAGLKYEDKDAEYCFLSDIYPDRIRSTPFEQTLQTLDIINNILSSLNMNFSNVVRTWFYLDQILEWYPEFNEARTKFYRENNIFNTIIPASTGIGASNLHGTVLVASALAIRPKHSKVLISSVSSPMQCEAYEYKSSFSRAIEITYPVYRRLLISGTASIDEDGNSVHIGNLSMQIDQTMKVLDGIIKSRGYNWNDVIRSIAYFKNLTNYQFFRDYCLHKRLPEFPVCLCESDICRDDLLFEIELDLVTHN